MVKLCYLRSSSGQRACAKHHHSGGRYNAEVSNSNPTLITPAGYVFVIWGVIYVLLGIFVIYQALPRMSKKGFHERISWLFVLSSGVSILWLFVWQYNYLGISVVLMFLLLASLILIHLRLDIGRAKVDLGEWLAVHLPFSVYFGWITIVSITNVAVTLVAGIFVKRRPKLASAI